MLQEPMWMAKYTLILQDKKNFENKTVCILDAGVGVLPIIAARSGAKMVYAVESSALRDTMEVLVKDNGQDIQSRITIVKDIDDVDVKVDVILISPMGILYLHGNYLSKLVKARDKLLQSDGVVVPKSLKIVTAPLFDEKTTKYLKDQSAFWNDQHFFGVDLSVEAKTALMQTFAQTLTGRILKGALMSVSPSSHVIDLQNVTKEDLENFVMHVTYKVAHQGVVHGLAAWFELDLGFNECKILSGPTTDDSQWYTCRFLLPKPFVVSKNDNLEGVLNFQVNKLDSYNVTIDLVNSTKGIRSRHLYPMNHFVTHGMNSWDNGPGNNNYGHDGWHFCDQNNNNIGPVSRGQILDLLRQGKLHQGSYVWKQGFGDSWTPISQFEELRQ